MPRDAFRLSLWFMVLLSISRIHQHFGQLGALRPALLAAVLALALAVLNASTLSWVNMKTRPARLMVALVVMACLSVPFGISIGNSGSFLLDAYFRVMLAYVLITLALRGPREISQFTWVFVISCGILAWMATSVFTLGVGMGDAQRLNELYMYDSNDLGVLLVMGIPLTLVAFETSGKWGRVAAAGILVWIGLALARSGSRGAFVGMAVMVPVFLLWAKHIRIYNRLVAIGVIVGALTIAAPFGYWEQMESLLRPTEDYNWNAEQGRRKVAIRGLGYMMANPLTGIGIDNFSKAEWTISDAAGDQFREHAIKGSAAHNTWIQAGSEMGIPGLALMVSLVFGSMAVIVKTHRRVPPSWLRGDREQRFLYSLGVYLPLSMLGFAVTSTFVSFAYMDPVYFLAALASGYLVAVSRKRRQLAGQLPANGV